MNTQSKPTRIFSFSATILLAFALTIFSSDFVWASLSKAEGEAAGSFTLGDYKGSGTLSFLNIGGVATLVTVCDMSTVDTADGERCEGVDLVGTFSGGRNGIATFKTETGAELKLPLNDGKNFTFSQSGISMNFTVTDPSIFDEQEEEVENTKARDSGARVSDLSGQVEIACPPDLEAWDVMKMGRVIYVDCHLKTGEDSTAEISLSDMTTFKLKPESEIVIDTPPEKDSKWKLLAGNIWVNVKKMIKDGTMEGHMSQAVAGIKGTTFVMHEDGTNSKLKVIEGVVNFAPKNGGESRDIASGQEVTATSEGLGETEAFDVAAESELWQKPIANNPVKADETGKETVPTKFIVGGIIAVLIIVIGLTLGMKRRKRKSEM